LAELWGLALRGVDVGQISGRGDASAGLAPRDALNAWRVMHGVFRIDQLLQSGDEQPQDRGRVRFLVADDQVDRRRFASHHPRFLRDKGQFSEDQTNVGKSSAADQRQHSQTKAKPGQGDRGDR